MLICRFDTELLKYAGTYTHTYKGTDTATKTHHKKGFPGHFLDHITDKLVQTSPEAADSSALLPYVLDPLNTNLKVKF